MKNDVRKTQDISTEMQINDLLFNILSDELEDMIAECDNLENEFEIIYFGRRILSVFQNNDMPIYAALGLLDNEKIIKLLYLDALLLQCSKSSPSAGNKCREVLSIAFKHALVEGYIKSNPMPGTRPYKRNKPKITIYNKAEVKQFLLFAKENSWYLEILLALFCGLRKGEILGLKFNDFNTEDETVTIKRQLAANPIIPPASGSKITKYELTERPPKTPNSLRKLKIPKVIIDELVRRKERIENNKAKYKDKYNDFNYISCQENGSPHSMSAFNTALNKLCKKASLPAISVHGLRHMYATILIENGASLSKISALLGHSSINTTFEYYCDISDESDNIKAFLDNTFIPEEEVN